MERFMLRIVNRKILLGIPAHPHDFKGEETTLELQDTEGEHKHSHHV